MHGVGTKLDEVLLLHLSEQLAHVQIFLTRLDFFAYELLGFLDEHVLYTLAVDLVEPITGHQQLAQHVLCSERLAVR